MKQTWMVGVVCVANMSAVGMCSIHGLLEQCE